MMFSIMHDHTLSKRALKLAGCELSVILQATRNFLSGKSVFKRDFSNKSSTYLNLAVVRIKGTGSKTSLTEHFIYTVHKKRGIFGV